MKPIDRFVVIDDDPTNNTICRIVLNHIRPDVKVISFENPLEALHFFSEPDYSKDIKTIIFLDINMPEMSGWEFLEVFDARSLFDAKDMELFILSSSINAEDKEKAKSDPRVRSFLEKPLTLSKVKMLFDQPEKVLAEI